jgi:hypothetical protein
MRRLKVLVAYSAFNEGLLTYGELNSTVEKISPERFKEISDRVFEEGHHRGLG